MTFKVYKYQLSPNSDTGICIVRLPYDYQVLSAHQQNSSVFIWVRIDPKQKAFIDVPFAVVPTGQEIGETYSNHHFIDTVHLDTELGPLVFHVFRLVSKSLDG